MRKNDWLIIAGAIIYCVLFYHQNTGINFLLYSLLLLGFTLFENKELLRQKSWLAVATGVLISSLTVFVYGNQFPVLANIVSLILLAGISFKPESSVMIAFIHAVFSALASIPIFVICLFNKSGKEESVKVPMGKNILFILMPLLVSTIFFFLYRASNPIFNLYAQKLNFDRITWQWVYFFLMGMVLMYAFFNQLILEDIAKVDNNSPDKLSTISHENHLLSWIGQRVNVSSEVFTGVLLFSLLNMLLFAVNGLDFYYLIILKKLPDGMSLSKFLHNGTNALIFSILLAVVIILFYFRGFLNFYKNNFWLKTLSCIWIVQNIILIISVAQRNSIYIAEYGLTHKRIGVYYYLALCVIGLATTAIKIYAQKSNWFLFRKNSWIFYTVMIVSCLIDWDSVITKFNIQNFEKDRAMEIDQHYRTDLSHTNLAVLYKYYVVEKKNLKSSNKAYEKRTSYSSSDSFETVYNQLDKESMSVVVEKKYKNLLQEKSEYGWQSFCLSKYQNLQLVEGMKQP